LIALWLNIIIGAEIIYYLKHEIIDY